MNGIGQDFSFVRILRERFFIQSKLFVQKNQIEL